jgi:hypothetical protein
MWWYKPVIPALQEAVVGELRVQGQPGLQKKTLSQKKKKKMHILTLATVSLGYPYLSLVLDLCYHRIDNEAFHFSCVLE